MNQNEKKDREREQEYGAENIENGIGKIKMCMKRGKQHEPKKKNKINNQMNVYGHRKEKVDSTHRKLVGTQIYNLGMKIKKKLAKLVRSRQRI